MGKEALERIPTFFYGFLFFSNYNEYELMDHTSYPYLCIKPLIH